LAAAYGPESFARGIADTARSVVASKLAGDNIVLMKKIMATNQSFFEFGAMSGPFVAGFLMSAVGGAQSGGALWLAPITFGFVASAYAFLPKMVTRRTVDWAAEQGKKINPTGNKASRRWMWSAMAITALLTTYPLKGVLPAIFGAEVLHDPTSAAWLAGLFGLGGFIGVSAYRFWFHSMPSRLFVVLAGLGTLSLAAAFLPGLFWPAAVGILLFAMTNGIARLTVSAAVQAHAGSERSGAAMAPIRTTANLTGLVVRTLTAFAFTAAIISPSAPYLIIATILTAMGIALIIISSRISH
jgi:MFS family permease